MFIFITYSAKVFISLLLFILIWKLFLRRENIFNFQRYFLLSSLILSIIIPLIKINFENIESKSLHFFTQTVNLNEIIIQPKYSTDLFQKILVPVYLLISATLLIRIIFKIFSIIKFASTCKVVKYKNTQIYITEQKLSPYSFFNYIFFNKTELQKPEFEKILIHEEIHVREKHSIDILFIELLIVFQWFNPLIYFFRKEIKMIHEYLSDEKVINNGFKSDEYKMLLINRQLENKVLFANYFNQSLTLKRIKMLEKAKPKQIKKLKILWLIPAISFLILSFSFSTKQTVIPSLPDKADIQDTIYDSVDEMPIFKGGDYGLRVFLAENVKYPPEAKKNKEQGTVYLKFVVSKDKKVEQVEIMKGASENLNNEALRAVKLIPDFEKPGFKDGKPVNVYYSLPVTFKLQ
jgi:TonB family protein